MTTSQMLAALKMGTVSRAFRIESAALGRRWGPRPTAGGGCRVGLSSAVCEEATDFVSAHVVKVLRNFQLALHEAEAILGRFLCNDGDHARKGLARLGDDEGLAARDARHQTRQVRLGFVDIDGGHGYIVD